MAESKKRAKKSFKIKKTAFIKILIVFIVVIALIGGGVYTLHNKSYGSLVTSVALHDDVINAVTAQVFIVRDEDYVTANNTANIVACVDDGCRVGKNMCVAYSFTNPSSAVNIKQIKETENKLEYYKKLGESVNNNSVTELDVLDGNIQNSLYDFISAVSDGDLTGFESVDSSLRESFASKQLATGESIDVSAEISELESKLTTLKGSLGNYSEVTASHSGYYISGSDGYENILDYDKMEEWTASDIQNAISSQAQSVPSNAIGRLVDKYYWYIACVVDSTSVSTLSVGSKRTIAFPYSTADDVTATVCRLKNGTDGKTLVVFKCNTMNSEVCELRNETAQIYISEFSGCKIDNRAIREVDGEKGVYILRANTAVFKKVNIVYSADDYSIADYPETHYNTERQCFCYYDKNGEEVYFDESDFIGLYDEYIIGGADLHDGKYLK